jgi:hypothetical protein
MQAREYSLGTRQFRQHVEEGVNAGNKVRLSNMGLAPLAGSTSFPPETSMESSSSVSAVDPEGTVAEVALELEGTDPSVLPNPDAEEPCTLREGNSARGAGATVGAYTAWGTSGPRGGTPPHVIRAGAGLVRPIAAG